MKTVLIASMLLFSAADGMHAQADTKPRRWRLIVNDDGEIPPPAANRPLARTLDDRFNAVRGTQVDAYFLCIASTDRLVARAAARPQDAMSQWARYGDVPAHVDQMIRLYIEEAHKEGIDIFLAARLNDIHDAWVDRLTYPLKVERPDLLHGDKQSRPGDALLDAHWSGFNWAEPEVRAHFLEFILWACEKWEFDGVELDWFRHPLFFRFGEEQANVENINQWVRDVRAGLNAIAKQRGRPCRLTTRPPDTPEIALRTGFDVEQWMKEGLLDMLMVGGGYMPYGGRLEQFIDMAHAYGIHAYPCQNHFVEPRKMHSIASGFFALGGDGFYMFNYGGADWSTPKGRCLEQIGDPRTLAGLDKTFIADNGAGIRYIGYTNPRSQFPVPLIGGAAIEIVVGDDLANVAGAVRATFTIRVRNLDNQTSLAAVVEGAPSNESIILQVNGRQLASDAVQRLEADTFIAVVPVDVFVNGINKVRVMPGPNCVGRLSSAVTGLELAVDYDPPTAEPVRRSSKAADRTLIQPTGPGSVSLFGVEVGAMRSIRFDIAEDLSAYSGARLALAADDFDARAELTITLNGGPPLPIPDALLSPSGRRVGLMDVPLAGLKPGENQVTFTFISNLGGTTGGFDVHEALLVLTPR